MRFGLLILTFISLLISCECPPSAKTPQEIIPTEFANICIFNVINSFSSIDVDTKYGYFLTGLNYANYTTTYKKIGSGNNLIYCKNASASFYSIPAYFSKNSYYTAILVGNRNEVNTILIEDNFGIIDNNKSIMRVINAMKYGDGLKFSNSIIGDKDLKYSEFTNFESIPIGRNDIKITYHGETIHDLLFDTKSGFAYSLVTYYDPTANNTINLSATIIEMPIK